MNEPQDQGPKPRFFDLEKDRARAEATRPDSLLRSTEWGGMTLISLIAALAFPPYFIQVLWLAFFNAGGLLWVVHLSEKGRDRLREFEKEFSRGHRLEEEKKFADAVALYESLIPAFSDVPRISEIARRRIAWIKQEHAQAFAPKPARKSRARKPK